MKINNGSHDCISYSLQILADLIPLQGYTGGIEFAFNLFLFSGSRLKFDCLLTITHSTQTQNDRKNFHQAMESRLQSLMSCQNTVKFSHVKLMTRQILSGSCQNKKLILFPSWNFAEPITRIKYTMTSRWFFRSWWSQSKSFWIGAAGLFYAEKSRIWPSPRQDWGKVWGRVRDRDLVRDRDRARQGRYRDEGLCSPILGSRPRLWSRPRQWLRSRQGSRPRQGSIPRQVVIPRWVDNLEMVRDRDSGLDEDRSRDRYIGRKLMLGS